MDELIGKFRELQMKASTEEEKEVYQKVIKIIQKKCCQTSNKKYFAHHYLTVCEKCGDKMSVKDSRERTDGKIRRKRQCKNCNNTVYTIESELDAVIIEIRERVFDTKISELACLLKKIEMQNRIAERIIVQLQGQQIKEKRNDCR